MFAFPVLAVVPSYCGLPVLPSSKHQTLVHWRLSGAAAKLRRLYERKGSLLVYAMEPGGHGIHPESELPRHHRELSFGILYCRSIPFNHVRSNVRQARSTTAGNRSQKFPYFVMTSHALVEQFEHGMRQKNDLIKYA